MATSTPPSLNTTPKLALGRILLLLPVSTSSNKSIQTTVLYHIQDKQKALEQQPSLKFWHMHDFGSMYTVLKNVFRIPT